jgi:hypothetical protein
MSLKELLKYIISMILGLILGCSLYKSVDQDLIVINI